AGAFGLDRGFVAEAVDGHVDPGAGQRLGDAEADPGGRAGDDGGFSLEHDAVSCERVAPRGTRVSRLRVVEYAALQYKILMAVLRSLFKYRVGQPHRRFDRPA